MIPRTVIFTLFYFFFNDTATTEIYTLSLHDALPIWRIGLLPLPPERRPGVRRAVRVQSRQPGLGVTDDDGDVEDRSEEHTSELQSRQYLVCRLLLEKKRVRIVSRYMSVTPIKIGSSH